MSIKANRRKGSYTHRTQIYEVFLRIHSLRRSQRNRVVVVLDHPHWIHLNDGKPSGKRTEKLHAGLAPRMRLQ